MPKKKVVNKVVKKGVKPEKVKKEKKIVKAEFKAVAKWKGRPMAIISGNFIGGRFNISREKVKAVLENAATLKKFVAGEYDAKMNKTKPGEFSYIPGVEPFVEPKRRAPRKSKEAKVSKKENKEKKSVVKKDSPKKSLASKKEVPKKEVPKKEVPQKVNKETESDVQDDFDFGDDEVGL